MLARRPLESLQRSFASSAWGMGSMWDRLANGFSFTDSMIARAKTKKEQERAALSSAPPQQDAPTKEAAGRGHTPWDAIRTKELFPGRERHRRHLFADEDGTVPFVQGARLNRTSVPSVPASLWMQSPFSRGSMQKLNAVARQVQDLPLDAALLQMKFSPKRAAQIVADVLTRIKVEIVRYGGDPAYYYVKEANVGRGTYLKRIDIKGRGRHGIQWRGHRMVRICCYKPDPERIARKLLRIRKFRRDDKPVLTRLNYN